MGGGDWGVVGVGGRTQCIKIEHRFSFCHDMK